MINQIIVLSVLTLCSCGEDNQQAVFDLPEGSKCSWNGLEGKCTNVNNCPPAKDAILQKSHPPICSFQGTTPVVCCTICKLNHSTTDPNTGNRVDLNSNQSSKARDHCLKYLKTLPYPCFAPPPFQLNEERSFSEKNFNDKMELSPLESDRSSQPLTRKRRRHTQEQSADGIIMSISHGMAAYRMQYPHMALLGYGDDVQTAQWLCGGSVISENYILTAAHCISSPAVGPVQFVALGILKRTDPPELWQKYNVKRIIAHPEYRPPSKYNDIALLETEKTIVFNYNVLPACLHTVPESSETAEATGWGALGHRLALADTLQTVKLHRYDEVKCSQLYPKHRHLREGYNHTSQMCYGDTETPKDTCEGDSGGPLQTTNEYPRCAYTVLGVTSYGRQCGISAGSGMYTRVYHYVPWIESIVWP